MFWLTLSTQTNPFTHPSRIKWLSSSESEPAKKKTGLPKNFCISSRMKTWAAEHDVHNLEAHFVFFRDKALARGYTYADWDRAFMTAVRQDWARIGWGRKKVAI